MTILYWFRNDLRLQDNPGFAAAIQSGQPIVPAYFWSKEDHEEWALGGASKWWLYHSLKALDVELQSRGSRLIIRFGAFESEVVAVAEETGAHAVFWGKRYEPDGRKQDAKVEDALMKAAVEVVTFNNTLLCEPTAGCKPDGSPYLVYTPYQKNMMSRKMGRVPLPAPDKVKAPKAWPKSVTVESLELLPTIPWDKEFSESWTPGSAGALAKLAKFIEEAPNYGEGRNLPATEGTSRLSPHLHFGEISPDEISHGLRQKFTAKQAIPGVETYIKELVWREFGYHLLVHYPETTTVPLREEFSKFPWTQNPTVLRAWQRGMTGYPIVDAGMRQLWRTGWMHNRVRMITASFLVKDLMISWQEGARWFWDTLVDADLASNTLGWQWTAGCGADAAPYFRVFNPTLQGEKFDPKGEYVRRWVPELTRLPNKWLHKPWDAPPAILQEAGIILGEHYPKPVVDHGEARDNALEAYEKMKESAQA